jgi:hypothetical protein
VNLHLSECPEAPSSKVLCQFRLILLLKVYTRSYQVELDSGLCRSDLDSTLLQCQFEKYVYKLLLSLDQELAHATEYGLELFTI